MTKIQAEPIIITPQNKKEKTATKEQRALAPTHLSPAEKARINGQLGGRPKGAKSHTTLEREQIMAQVKTRFANQAQRLVDAQMSVALGQQFLYKIHTNKKGIKDKAQLITDEFEIRAYLNGEYDYNDDGDYYFITTKEPLNSAIDSIFDRTFGKSVQPISGDGEGGEIVLKMIHYGATQKDEPKKLE